MFKEYAEVEQRMNELVDREFHDGAFLRHLREGRYSETGIRYFAVQYSYYSRNFPRVLGAAISAMAPLDSWWVPLADNLWDEAGRGGQGKAHERLYNTFLFSVDPDAEVDSHGMVREPMSEAVRTAIDKFISFFHQATPLAAMAAVGFGSEYFAGRVMKEIANGLRHPVYNERQPMDLTFWDVHADEHEPRHYQLSKDILVQHTRPEDLQLMFDVGADIARSEAGMYAGLHEVMIQLK